MKIERNMHHHREEKRKSMERKPRLIAFYLPQFHSIPENDEWWGIGFTEWTNAAKAKPLFRGHYQPHVPADLGFYDLRVPETRKAQAEMAREHGIEAFCYYHYWFAGKQLLERPFNEVLASGDPNYPFCICWANQTWTGIWHGAPNRILIEQTYPGINDHKKHFEYLLGALTDRRYVTVDGKPLILIFKPLEIPKVEKVIDLWRGMAQNAGLNGLYFVGFSWTPEEELKKYGFDGSLAERLPPRRPRVSLSRPIEWLIRKINIKMGKPTIFHYKKILPKLLGRKNSQSDEYPCVIPNWDNTPRSGNLGLVLHESTPELFRIHLKQALQLIQSYPAERRIVFVKSWNEWAEGNHLEPDLKFGRGYLQVIKEEMQKG
jgi:lipopolysaccharide biosynthesis protein